MVNYYEILEVSEKASKEVIEKAYKALAKKYHPDLNKDNPKEAEAKMKEINEAYEILINDTKRAYYDRILSAKRTIDNKKANMNNASSTNSGNSQVHNESNRNIEDYNTISYSNGYYTDNDDNFFVNTKNMDEKTKKKLQAKLQERYLEAYDSYLREHGYRLKYRWTFKKVMQLILTILISAIVFVILFYIPPIHEYCMNLYNDNPVVHILVNLVISLFSAIFSVFKS